MLGAPFCPLNPDRCSRPCVYDRAYKIDPRGALTPLGSFCLEDRRHVSVCGHLGYRGKSIATHGPTDSKSRRASIAVRLKMKAPKKSPTYTAEQSKVLTDRLFALRANWLRHVETQLASTQNRKDGNQAVALTRREEQIAVLIGSGFTNKEIATVLALSDGTVKVHAHNIFQKLGVKTRHALVYDLVRR
jgi:DNA-binding CsgD family transcriptional regulator